MEQTDEGDPDVLRGTEGDDVDEQSRKQQVSSQDAPTEESFEHSAANDLGGLLEIYARPDRRVLERRSRTSGSSSFGPNDRRVSDRRSPTAETEADTSNDRQVTASISEIPEGPSLPPQTS